MVKGWPVEGPFNLTVREPGGTRVISACTLVACARRMVRNLFYLLPLLAIGLKAALRHPKAAELVQAHAPQLCQAPLVLAYAPQLCDSSMASHAHKQLMIPGPIGELSQPSCPNPERTHPHTRTHACAHTRLPRLLALG